MKNEISSTASSCDDEESPLLVLDGKFHTIGIMQKRGVRNLETLRAAFEVVNGFKDDCDKEVILILRSYIVRCFH